MHHLYYTLKSLEKTHTKLFIKHLTTQLTLFTAMDATLNILKKKMKLYPGKSLIEFISLYCHGALN